MILYNIFLLTDSKFNHLLHLKYNKVVLGEFIPYVHKSVTNLYQSISTYRQLAESRRLVATAKSKEKEYEKTIGELRLRLQEASSSKEYQAQSLKELNKQVTKLKSRNKVCAI